MLIARSPRDPYGLSQVLGMLVLFDSLCVLQAPRLSATRERFAIQALAQKPL